MIQIYHSNIVVCMHKYFKVKELIVYCIVKQCEYAFEYDQWGPFAKEAWRGSFASHVVVIRDANVFSLFQLLKCILEQSPIEDVRVVEVNTSNIRHLLFGALFVKAINRNQRTLFIFANPNALKNLITNSSFSRCSSTSNANEDWLHIRAGFNDIK